jgi:cyclopropane-fatty-acyl-phospholipid synthase
MWEFYLAGAEAGFREGDLAVFQIQMAKDRHVVPLTRDYITDADRAEPTAHRIAAE